MALNLQAFDRAITFAKGNLAGDALRKEFAAFARASLADAIKTGVGSAAYTRFVNGRAGLTEDQVRLPGPIVYEFSWLEEVIAFAVTFLRTRYPVRGSGGGPGFPGKHGHYADTHLVMIGGKRWAGGPILPTAEVTVVNTQPYARKVQVGAHGFALSRGIYEDARQATLRKFRGLIEVQLRFIALSPGYVLKSRGGAKRKDTRAGQALTYPALIITRRVA